MTNVSTTEINPSQSTSLVTVTPTEILNSKVAALVDRYRLFAKASAENIIQLAKTLSEANSQLTKSELMDFCREIGVKEKSSTYRKLLQIGLNADRFENHVGKMPTAWTTVYNLSKLTPDEFEKVATNEAFSPTMTARSISTIVGSKAKAPSKQDNTPKATLPDVGTKPVDTALVVSEPLTSPKTITLNLEGLNDSDVEEVYNHIVVLRADKQFTFEMSNGMRAFESSLDSKNLFQMEQAA